jgi:uncharacterized membrane protein
MNGELVENKPLFLSWRPNRSLSRKERIVWFALIAGTTLLIALFAAMVGAWLVLPFAGAEVCLVGLAFYIIGRHDHDMETLLVTDEQFRWELRLGEHTSSLSGNRRWLQVSSWDEGHLLNVNLRYSGKCVAVGVLASDEQRRDMVRNLQHALVGRRISR